MAKTIQINLRVDDETISMLMIMAKKTVRTKTDMVTFLIRQEFEQGGYDLQNPENGRYDVGAIKSLSTLAQPILE